MPARDAGDTAEPEELALDRQEREDRADPGDIPEEDYAYREDGEEDTQRGNVGGPMAPGSTI